MTMRTCSFCKKQIDDYVLNWHNKYCCNACYSKSKSGYSLGDVVYTYANKKHMPENEVEAITAKGTIKDVYKLYNPTKNGLYQFVIQLDSGKVVRRFAHQIFSDEQSCGVFTEKTNKRRSIMREARKLLNTDVDN